jgi:hypothetical protein
MTGWSVSILWGPVSSQREASDLAGHAGAVSGMLASDRDRDVVADLLNEAFAEGRLTAAEHGERVRVAYAARAWAELARLTADLPPPAGHAAGHPAPMLECVERCLLCALLVLCPPAGIAWLLAARRRSRPGRGQLPEPGQAAVCAGQPTAAPDPLQTWAGGR